MKPESTEADGDGCNIQLGHGRYVTGTFYAKPGDYYRDEATGTDGLDIQIELFHQGDTYDLDASGLYTATQTLPGGRVIHADNEISSINNVLNDSGEYSFDLVGL